MFKVKLLNFLKTIGNGIGAIGYYFSSIIILLSLITSFNLLAL